jgi:hypothetical protein
MFADRGDSGQTSQALTLEPGAYRFCRRLWRQRVPLPWRDAGFVKDVFEAVYL